MKDILDKIRVPEKVPLKMQVTVTAGILLLGFSLGVLQKWMDSSSGDRLPLIVQQLDIRNYFGRLGVWILLGTCISVYAKSPLRAAVNTFSFFASMLAGYYLYCHYILGFLPKTDVIFWAGASFLSAFMAYICWYAKGKGMPAVLISGVVAGVLLAQAVSLTQGFYVYHFMEILTWMVGVIVLLRSPKELAAELGLAVVTALVYQLVIPHWG